MSRIDKVLLRPGDSVHFQDRDDLLVKLDRLAQRVPARHKGRTRDHREHFVMVSYLGFLAGAGGDFLRLPVTLEKPFQDPPDFILKWPDGSTETFELTDGSTEEYQKRLTAASATRDLVLPVDINTSEKEATQLWADILFAAFLKKAEGLVEGRFGLDHLLLYDLTGLGLLLPLECGGGRLRQKLREWHIREAPAHRFMRISVLRDSALLFDAEGEGRVLESESPFFRISVISARNEKDLKKRIRELDFFCRKYSIRHLKSFGSILGDIPDPFEDDGRAPHVFREDSDLDLLVEFEPSARVTLLDMARMERELSELTGFKVDLRTAEDLSRYFRHKILQAAVEVRTS